MEDGGGMNGKGDECDGATRAARIYACVVEVTRNAIDMNEHETLSISGSDVRDQKPGR